MKISRFYLVVISLLLPACGGIYYSYPHQDGAGVQIDINTIQDAQPIIEPITKAGNKSPYTQFGVTYEIIPSSVGYREVGTASWYGSKFHGRRTSNGDIYNMYLMTAAHKTLPIPTYVRVTRLDTQKTIIVRVNDRGPFHNQRIIDLSYAAAVKLGFSESGTAEVLIEAIDASVSPPSIQEKAYLQIGAFDNPESAVEYADKFDHQIAAPIGIKAVESVYKVLVGPFRDSRELLEAKQTLKRESNISAFAVNR
ncbi:MAG: septal ring lytic transglycosylase RlpA family protein [Porticoccaceae bacterium]